jgi:hypothetical protein
MMGSKQRHCEAVSCRWHWSVGQCLCLMGREMGEGKIEIPYPFFRWINQSVGKVFLWSAPCTPNSTFGFFFFFLGGWWFVLLIAAWTWMRQDSAEVFNLEHKGVRCSLSYTMPLHSSLIGFAVLGSTNRGRNHQSGRQHDFYRIIHFVSSKQWVWPQALLLWEMLFFTYTK